MTFKFQTVPGAAAVTIGPLTIAAAARIAPPDELEFPTFGLITAGQNDDYEVCGMASLVFWRALIGVSGMWERSS